MTSKIYSELNNIWDILSQNQYNIQTYNTNLRSLSNNLPSSTTDEKVKKYIYFHRGKYFCVNI